MRVPTREPRRVLVTRPAAQAAELCEALEDVGAIPVLLPLLIIEANPAASRSRLWDTVPEYDWIVFTSANGVRHAWPHATDALRNHPRIAVVGPATAKVVVERGGRVCMTAPTYVAESLADTLGDVEGLRILWLRGNDVRDVLGPTLRTRGAWVDECIVYHTRHASLPDNALESVRDADVAMFASPSAVRRFVECFGTAAAARVLCIGPITEAAAKAEGLRVDAVADSYTAHGLVGALESLDA
jgi:uroporphyrinogen III methyltransferase/synthase